MTVVMWVGMWLCGVILGDRDGDAVIFLVVVVEVVKGPVVKSAMWWLIN